MARAVAASARSVNPNIIKMQLDEVHRDRSSAPYIYRAKLIVAVLCIVKRPLTNIPRD